MRKIITCAFVPLTIFCVTGFAAGQKLWDGYFQTHAQLMASEAGREDAQRHSVSAQVQLDALQRVATAADDLEESKQDFADAIRKSRSALDAQIKKDNDQVRQAEAANRRYQEELDRMKAEILKDANDAERAYFDAEEEFEAAEEVREAAISGRRAARAQADAADRAAATLRDLKSSSDKLEREAAEQFKASTRKQRELQKKLDRLKNEILKK